MGKQKDLTGKKFGHLTALEPVERQEPSNKCYFWKCRCDCGNIHIVNMNNLQMGNTKSCGCLKHKRGDSHV
jgi:hypothetical protein